MAARNVFVIPSWYPNPISPVAGIFTREQVDATADLCRDYRMIVSTWGHDEGTIPFRTPWTIGRMIAWRLRQRPNQVRARGQVHEVFNPAISWSDRLPIRSLARLLRVNRKNFRLATDQFGPIDLIHAHVSYPGGHIARLIAAENAIPYLVTEHFGPFPPASLADADGRPNEEIMDAFAGAAASMAVSPALADRIASFGLPKPVVVPNVVDERRFSPGPAAGGKFRFFTLGRIDPLKGIDDLLHAIAIWNPPAEDVEFHIGGAGAYRAAYEQLAKSLGVSDRVVWLGPIAPAEAPTHYRNAHAFVLPSLHESFGVVYVEAMASGKPVIATRCGGPESFVDESNGLLVDVGDRQGLASALRAMRETWSRYDAGRIRSEFEQRFSRPAVVAKIGAIYASVLMNRQHPALR